MPSHTYNYLHRYVLKIFQTADIDANNLYTTALQYTIDSMPQMFRFHLV